MSKSAANVRPTRVQKICALWTHDENFSRDEVVFNIDKFVELPIASGSLARILAIKQTTAVRDFQTALKTSPVDPRQSKVDEVQRDLVPETEPKKAPRRSVTITLDENGVAIQGSRDVDPQKSYVFVTKPMSPEQKAKHPNLQVRHTLFHYHLVFTNSRRSPFPKQLQKYSDSVIECR